MPHVEGYDKLEGYLWGIIAEWLCFVMLIIRGYNMLERRWKSPVGEIDLIAQKNNLLVFVEVKARPTFEKGAEAVSVAQRIRIENATRSWLASNPKFAGHDIRFDAMIVTPWRLPHHIIDAWRPTKS